MGYNKRKSEQWEVPDKMEIDQFCEWFEGEFDNWGQASSNPTKWAHIFVTHEHIEGRKFRTSSRYNYMKQPYREQIVEVTQPEIIGATVPIIIVKNPACDIVFSFVEGGNYWDGVSEPECTFKDKPLESKARLYKNEYHTWDKGYWEGSDGFFLFKKNV